MPKGLSFGLLMRTATITDQLSQHANALAPKFREDLPLAVSYIEKILSANSGEFEFQVKTEPTAGIGTQPHTSVAARAKGEASIKAKLGRRALNENLDVPDLETSKRVIGDGIGVRLVLNSPQIMDDTFSHILAALNDGSALITEIHNYHDENLASYLTSEQFSELKLAAIQAAKQAANRSGGVISGQVHIKEKPQPSGYTSLNLKFLIFPHGVVKSDGAVNRGIPVELQIRGEKVDELANAEHIYYDVLRFKKIDAGNNPKLRQIVESLKSLNNEQIIKLRQYLREWYAYARNLELTEPDRPLFSHTKNHPALPARFPFREVLSIENVAETQGL